jgi:hypothetical protein
MNEADRVRPRPVPPIEWFNSAFETLLNYHPLPQPTPFRGMTSYRFEEKSLKAAVLLKLARYVSGLNAGKLLLENGFFQELCSLQRSLDEIQEDILFLSLPAFTSLKTADHDAYLEHFWSEEPEFREFSANQKNRWSIPRKKVRSYLSTVNFGDAADHQSIAISAYLNRLLSGYVHAAAPQLLELYDPNRQAFRLEGYLDSPLFSAHAEDFENHFFRGVVVISMVARLVGEETLAQDSWDIHKKLEAHFH